MSGKWLCNDMMAFRRFSFALSLLIVPMLFGQSAPEPAPEPPRLEQLRVSTNTDGTGTANAIPVWSDFDTLGNSIMFQQGSSIGIGTNSPLRHLSIEAGTTVDAGIRVARTSYANSPYLDFMLNTAGIPYAMIQAGDLATWRALTLNPFGGNVGIGTSDPKNKFHLYSAATADAYATFGFDGTAGPAVNVGYAGASYGRSAGFINVRPDAAATAPNPSLRFLTADVQRMIITNTGRVGIGTSAPAAALDIAGDAHISGNLNVDGSLAAKYQDVAEWVPASNDLEPGTVVVLSRDRVNEVSASTRAYDTSVAGVVSGRPGMILGEAAKTKEMVATTGRVRVKVDATKHPIAIGDLLVSSDRKGTAMRSEPMRVGGRDLHQPGTIVGKALEPLAGGTGEILVLLSLQ